MWNAVKGFVRSKKGLALLAGLASWGVGRAGFDIPAADLYAPIAFIGSYIFGQGLADFGKERERIRAERGTSD